MREIMAPPSDYTFNAVTLLSRESRKLAVIFNDSEMIQGGCKRLMHISLLHRPTRFSAASDVYQFLQGTQTISRRGGGYLRQLEPQKIVLSTGRHSMRTQWTELVQSYGRDISHGSLGSGSYVPHEDGIPGTPREKRKLLCIPAIELIMTRTREEDADEITGEKDSGDVFTKDELSAPCKRIINGTYSPLRYWDLTAAMGCGAPWSTPREHLHLSCTI